MAVSRWVQLSALIGDFHSREGIERQLTSTGLCLVWENRPAALYTARKPTAKPPIPLPYSAFPEDENSKIPRLTPLEYEC